MAQGAARAGALPAFAAWALAFGLVASADAQTNRNLAEVERDRRAEAARAEALRAQAEAAGEALAMIDQRLAQSEQRRAEAETAALDAGERLTALNAEIQAREQARARSRRNLEAALMAAAFAERRLEPRVVRVGVFANAALKSLALAERRNSAALDRAWAMRIGIETEQTILADAQSAIDAEQSELSAMAAQRRAAQTRLASDAEAAQRRARTLAAEARSLRELAQRASRRTQRAAASGPSVVPAAWLAPAQGRITSGYGVRQGEAPATQGVRVRTGAGAEVISPAAGEVAYAGPFRSYGNVLILDIAGGYALVLTGLETMQVQVGETVQPGQFLGRMPESDTSAPDLYVEVRRNGQPVDPERWLSARGLVADRGARSG